MCSLLPLLASTHPDPAIRHITFRILAMALALSPPVMRLDVLKQLIEGDPDEERSTGAMQVAAIGLVREAVVEAFQAPSGTGSQNIFRSPHILQILGPILLRPSPLDFFSSPSVLTTLKDPDTFESARLTECVGFYYTILVRDVQNSVSGSAHESLS